MKIVTAHEAVSAIEDHWTIVPGGFGSCGHPDELTQALRERFQQTGRPRGLTYLFAAGPGDKAGRGLDAIALEGLVERAIGGFWGLCPTLTSMARAGTIEAHNWPQGVVSKMFSAIASGEPGLLSRVGLGTFVDPDVEGGVIDGRGSATMVRKTEVFGHEMLFYPAQPVQCALLRGTTADAAGNISFEDETSYMDALAQAQAAKRSKGLVIVQVKRVCERLQPHSVKVPGFLVDRVVVARADMHPQTYGCAHDPRYTSNEGQGVTAAARRPVPLEKTIIAHRAALELARHPGATVNLGIGVPALIGPIAASLGVHDYTLTVESGLIGGVPDEGLSFGAVRNPVALIEQAALFNLYDGGGIDVAFLGFAQADALGNVNVSRFADKLTGSGGFINISQAARKIVFCGTFSADGLRVALGREGLLVLNEGTVVKFQDAVSHLTFNGPRAVAEHREVMFITERAVFVLGPQGLVLTEVAPGVSPKQLQQQVPFDLAVSPSLREMAGPWREPAGLQPSFNQ